ncbi:signal recognition particle subunit SRP72-like [Ranitomeya imitator]|uniref:signal recognition particle subunit SRP72-like n=1 Tax=Ranitomeya imitator TaxID=111125 RepID=UPI0037E7055C
MTSRPEVTGQMTQRRPEVTLLVLCIHGDGPAEVSYPRIMIPRLPQTQSDGCLCGRDHIIVGRRNKLEKERSEDASKTASSPPTSPRPGVAATNAPSTANSNVVPPRHQKPVGAAGTKKKQQQKKKKGGRSGW